MAQNYSVSVNLQSVDYTGALASGTCYTAANAGSFGRNRYSITPTVNMVVDDNNLLTFSWGGYTGSSAWYVCSVNGYHLDVQFSPNNADWRTISSSYMNEAKTQSCDGVYRAWQMLQDLTNMLTSVQLTEPGYLRIITWTERACPTTDLPNAYPNQVASEAVAAEIHIDVKTDYRPGETWVNGRWMSHDRTDGDALLCLGGNNWREMRTEEYKGGRLRAPIIYRGGDWTNMAKIGAE